MNHSSCCEAYTYIFVNKRFKFNRMIIPQDTCLFKLYNVSLKITEQAAIAGEADIYD